MENNKINFCDLYAGIGGFHEGIRKFTEKSGIEFKFKFACEIDKETADTYERQWGHNAFGDVSKLSPSQYEDIDFLCAGFPCQPFSKAGSRLGFDDPTKGTAFYDIKNILEARILKGKPIPYALLENVPNIITHDSGRTWEIIHETLTNLGYVVPEKPIVLSPHMLGTPQTRNRAFIPCIYKDNYNHDATPPTDLEKLLNKPTTGNVTSMHTVIGDTLENRQAAIINERQLNILDFYEGFLQIIQESGVQKLGFPMNLDFITDKPIDTTGMANWVVKNIPKNQDLYKNNPKLKEYFTKNQELIDSMSPTEKKFEWQAGYDIQSIKDGTLQFRTSGLRVKRPTEFPTLVATVHTSIFFDKELGTFRKMTLTEGKRLQGLSDDFILSDNEHTAWRQLGNAVNADVICAMISIMAVFTMR